MSDGRLPSSFRDPSGFVFTRDGALHRQINRSYAGLYAQFMQSGLYDRLAGEGLLVPHDEVDVPPADAALAHTIIRPQAVPFVSYPYEWPFAAYQAAALTTLRIQDEAMRFGMTLKDASAFNIQFVDAKPVFIDTLSFEPYREGAPWVAYQQFCKHFLAPLALMARRDIRFGRWLQIDIDGVPLDLASKLLPMSTRFNAGLLMHVHLHAKSQAKYADDPGGASGKTATISRRGVLGIVDSLRTTIDKLAWAPMNTEWGAYYEATNYSDDAMRAKEALVAELLDRAAPKRVWDLGANTGRFSRIASRRGIPTVAFDIDPVAVNANYRACRADDEKNLLPLLLDLTNPSPSIGWQTAEREAFMARGPVDTVLALALVHHLALSNNVPLPMLAEFFAALCDTLIIEFVPKSDSQVQRLLATREDVFANYHIDGFRESFATRFEILDARPVTDTERTIFLMRRRGMVHL